MSQDPWYQEPSEEDATKTPSEELVEPGEPVVEALEEAVDESDSVGQYDVEIIEPQPIPFSPAPDTVAEPTPGGGDATYGSAPTPPDDGEAAGAEYQPPPGHKLVTTALGAAEALKQMVNKKRKGNRVYMVVGDTNSGKTAFSWRIKDMITHGRHRKFQRVSDRTWSGYVNFADISGFPLIFDLAGEDFNKFGTQGGYELRTTLLENFVWPALRIIDGLILIIDFPTIWVEYNEAVLEEGPNRAQLARTVEKREGDLSDAFQRLIQLAALSRDWTNVAAKASDGLGGDPTRLPDYQQVVDNAHSAKKLDIPVFVALSKADAYQGDQWGEDGFLAPSPSEYYVAVDPLETWPRAVVRARMQHLYDFIEQRVRNYTFGFVQSFDAEGVIRSEDIDAQTEKKTDSLLGAEDVIAFLDGYPWRLGPPFIGTRMVHKLHEIVAPMFGKEGDPWKS